MALGADGGRSVSSFSKNAFNNYVTVAVYSDSTYYSDSVESLRASAEHSSLYLPGVSPTPNPEQGAS